MKMTINELRAHIATLLTEVNLWNHEYVYDAKRDSVHDLAQAALKWFHFDKNYEKWSSPSDSRFQAKLRARLLAVGVDDHAARKVLNAFSAAPVVSKPSVAA